MQGEIVDNWVGVNPNKDFLNPYLKGLRTKKSYSSSDYLIGGAIDKDTFYLNQDAFANSNKNDYFYGFNRNLKTLDLPESVKLIGNHAFVNCVELC